MATLVLAVAALTIVFALQAKSVRDNLEVARSRLRAVEVAVRSGQLERVRSDLDVARNATASAASTVGGPLWNAAGALPVLGHDANAVRTVTVVVDSLTSRTLPPLVDAADALRPEALAPRDGRIPLGPITAIAGSLAQARVDVDRAGDDLAGIATEELLKPVADAVTEVRSQLVRVTGTVHTADVAARLAPAMLGANGPRTYLLLIQNNAEVRAAGGIPGAVAVLRFTDGKIELIDQASAIDVHSFPTPVLPLGVAGQIHSDRLGRYLQNVTFTPDFPTTGRLAQEMWRRHTAASGRELRVDGVVSVDPVALSYLLTALGPVDVSAAGVSVRLTSDDAVPFLLSRVYASVPSPKAQDALFARVGAGVFAQLTSGVKKPKELLGQLSRAAEERRILLWSAHPDEQSVIAGLPIAGMLPQGATAGRSFGVYFNDGTGAKMSYYLRPSINVVGSCSAAPTTVTVTLASVAPRDAATTLPRYVTGGGAYGVPAGDTATVVLVYGPPGSTITALTVDGRPANYALNTEFGRPVAAVGVRTHPSDQTRIKVALTGVAGSAPFSVDHTPMVAPVPVTVPAC